MPTSAEIYEEAKKAAELATLEAKLKFSHEPEYNFGKVYIVLKPARGSFVTYLKSIGGGETRDWGGGGFIMYDPTRYPNNLRLEMQRAGAEAVGDVLMKYDIKTLVHTEYFN